MTRKQYNNVIQWTLLKCSSAEEDSLSVCRAVLKNLGMPFPKGNYRDVLRVLMSNEYMGWHSCTLEQAAECADQGIPAVGISTSRVLVLAPDGEEEAVIKEAVNPEVRKAFIPSSEELSLDERMEMQFFAYAEIGNGVMQLAGRTVYPYPSPRYIKTKDGNGAKIRYSPNGSFKIGLDENSVLLVHRVNAVYAGGYNWIEVTYFKIMKDENTNIETCTEGAGWIAVENTEAMPKVFPGKNDVTGILNKRLTRDQKAMLINARYIYHYFRYTLDTTHKWTNNAIYAMLGNMVQESTVNPNYWQNGNVNVNNGYGLAQWTPATKYFEWVDPRHWPREDVSQQVAFLQYTVYNTDQWQAWRHSPSMSFYDYTKSDKSVSALVEYFLRCYEKPNVIDSNVINYREDTAYMLQRWIEAF